MRPITNKPERTTEYLKLVKPVWELNEEVMKMVMVIWDTKTILKAAFDKLNNELDEDYFKLKNPKDSNKHEEIRMDILNLIESSIGIIDDHCIDLSEVGYWENLDVWEKYNFPTKIDKRLSEENRKADGERELVHKEIRHLSRLQLIQVLICVHSIKEGRQYISLDHDVRKFDFGGKVKSKLINMAIMELADMPTVQVTTAVENIHKIIEDNTHN